MITAFAAILRRHAWSVATPPISPPTFAAFARCFLQITDDATPSCLRALCRAARCCRRERCRYAATGAARNAFASAAVMLRQRADIACRYAPMPFVVTRRPPFARQHAIAAMPPRRWLMPHYARCRRAQRCRRYAAATGAICRCRRLRRCDAIAAAYFYYFQAALSRIAAMPPQPPDTPPFFDSCRDAFIFAPSRYAAARGAAAAAEDAARG